MSVKIDLLADFQVQIDGAAVALSAKKSRALLAWLACHAGQAQPRERLAGLLWGDRSAANARASLRQAVAGLRKILPEPVLAIASGELQLNSQAVSCDLIAVRALLQAGDPQSWRALPAAYRGDLLEGFSSGAEPFDEWLLLEREHLRQGVTAALLRLLAVEESASDAPAAAAVASRLLSLDPLQEPVHRSLMRSYAAQGQLGAARRQFKLCRDVLARELGSPPAQETLALLQSLGQESAAAAPAAPAAAAAAATTPSEPLPIAPVAPRVAPDRRAALPSIAVLPFRAQPPDGEHDYLADGMTEELINLLASSANWRVSGRSQSFFYRKQDLDLREIGQQLGAAYAVEGSVRAGRDRVRINARLSDTQEGVQLWSERYDRPLTDLFAIQDEVAHAIFRTLKRQLGFAERERVRRTPSTNLNAWGLLMKAMQVQVTDNDTRLAQLALVRESLAVEPDYPRAHGYLASLLFTGVGRGSSTHRDEDLAQARRHLEAAVDHGASDPVVLRFCAGGMAAVGESAHALGLAERAFELSGAPDPLLVAVLTWSGRLAEAREHAEAIVRDLPDNAPLAPGELRPIGLLGNLCMLEGNLPLALEYALRDQRANPGNYFAHVNVANIHGLMGHSELAREAWDLAVRIVPKLTVRRFERGYLRVCADRALGQKYAAGLYAAGIEAPQQ